MPTIHREHGLRFVIYTSDHEPAHVHVFGGGELKVIICGAGGLPELEYAIRMKAHDRRRAMDVVMARQAEFLACWCEIHGDRP